MSAHDDVVTAILEVLHPVGGKIRLLGRVSDPVIGSDARKEVFFFVPDLHLVSEARQERFGEYGFNHAESGLLTRILRKMAALRERWDARGDLKLVTVSLGDFFDLWREFPTTARPEEIGDGEHGDLRDLLYRGIYRGKPCLKATMLLGNHDTKRGTPLEEVRFQLKAFNRSRRGTPFLFATHGDAFDQLEALPDFLQEFVVYFLGKLTPVNKYTLSDWGKMTSRTNKPLGKLNHAITTEQHDLDFGDGAVAVAPGRALPRLKVREGTAPDDLGHPHFAEYYDAVRAAAEQFPSAQNLRVVVTGHTHRARMDLCRPADGGRPLLLMDVGSWIETCEYPTPDQGTIVEPCAQLAVIHRNDARLYQMSVPG